MLIFSAARIFKNLRPGDDEGASVVRMQPSTPPTAAPPLALADLEGRPQRLEDFRGKVVMLFFWHTA